MSYSAQSEYLMSIYLRYKNSNKKNKTQILNEFCQVCGLSRKHAIRLLKTGKSARSRRSGPKPRYPLELLQPVIEYVWRSMGEINSKKVKAGLEDWLTYIAECDHPEYFTTEVIGLLQSISASTIDRILKLARDRYKKGPSLTPDGRKKWMNRIPMQPKDWNVTKPGHVQSDTVAHCGDSLLGSFAFSLTVTDIYSGWTENRAIFTKGTQFVVEQMGSIEKTLPFDLYVFKSDSGTEFMSYRLQRYLEERTKPVRMVRSRPYKKDDNCYVEQKNFTHVRELFGYERIRTRELTQMMNDIYINYWGPLQNFFIPSTKLLRKTRIGARIKKEFEPLKTPYQRVLESNEVPEEKKQELIQRKKALNPFKLRKALDEKLREFFELVRKSNTRAA